MTVSIPRLPMDDEAYWQDPYTHLRRIREKHRIALNDQGHVATLHWKDAVWALKEEAFRAEGIEVLERRGFDQR